MLLILLFCCFLGLGAIQWHASVGLQGDGNLPVQGYADSVILNSDPIAH